MNIEHQGLYSEYLTCLESVLLTIAKSMGLEDEVSLLGRYSFFLAPEEGLEISPKILPVDEEWSAPLGLVRHPVNTAVALDAKIATALERGRPVALPVDLYTWPHTPHFQKRHQPHFVALFGQEGSGPQTQYHVVCPYYNFEGVVGRQEVHDGYFSSDVSLPNLMTLERLDHQPLSTEEVRTLVAQSCAYMLGTAVPEALAGVDRQLLGCAGMSTFATRLETLVETQGERLGEMQELVDLSRYLMVVGYARHWFSRFLAVHETQLFPGEENIEDRLLEITQGWIAVGKRLAMGLHGRRNALVVQSLRRVEQLATQEQDFFTTLAERLQGGHAVPPTEAPGTQRTNTSDAPWPARPPVVAPREPGERRLAAAYADLLGLEEVGRDDDFFQLGGDSVLLIRLTSRIREDFGIKVGFYTFFEAPTVAQLAAHIQASPPPILEQELDSLPEAPRPLTPSQQDGFADGSGFHHWNVALFFEVDRELHPRVLRAALEAVLRHHVALRARFERHGEQWFQVFESPGAPPLTTVDLRALPPSHHRTAMESAAAALQPRFDLQRTPLLRFLHFRRGPQQLDRLFVLFHHLLLDGYSLDLVMDDLRRAAEQRARGDEIRLPAPVTSFNTWVERLHLHAGSPEITAQFETWQALPWSQVAALPVDHPNGQNRQDSVETVLRVWDADASRRLTGLIAGSRGVTVADILLAGLARTLASWTGNAVQAIETFSHGRLPEFDPNLDVSRTVGFFSYAYPVVVEVSPDAEPMADVEQITAQARKTRGGLAYALLRFLHPQAHIREAMAQLPTAQVKLNFRGHVGRDAISARSLLRLSDEHPGWTTPSSRPRSALLRVVGRLVEDRLHLAWQYSSNCNHRSTVEGLAARLDTFLRALPGVSTVPQKTATAVPDDLRTPVQDMLSQIWLEALRSKDPNLGSVGLHDNFFELGGHSLLAMQVISRVRQSFQVEMPLRILFEVPTVAELAEHVEEALRNDEMSAVPAIQPAPRNPPPPLSFAQERLWFLDQLAPGGAAYNLSLGVHFAGRLVVPALAMALGEIRRRHEALRTRFEYAEAEARPIQTIEPPTPRNPLPQVDLSALSASALGADLRQQIKAQLVRQETQRPYDLAQGPVFRAVLLRLAPEEHTLLVGVHHIVSDGWSMSLLFRELAAHYDAYSHRRPAEAKVLPIQYADYATWQRQWLRGETLERQLDWWKERLQGAPAVLDLPTDRPRPAVQSERGARHRFRLPDALATALQELSHRQDVTVFMTLLGAFVALLHRFTGQRDLPIGTPIAGRHRMEVEPLIGLFVNTLVLRTDLTDTPSPTFLKVLERVRETALGAYTHQEIPFEKLVDELAPERSLGHTPLFQVMFVLQNASRGAVRFPGLWISSERAAGETSQFDLTLTMFDRKGGLQGFMDYRTELFDATTVARWSKQFEALLQGAVADVNRPLSQLSALSPAERHELCLEWNDTAQILSKDNLCLHDLVNAQIRRTPEAVAVVFEGQQLNYGELGARAHGLAHFLRRRGVGPEVLVGVAMERSVDLVVALFGILVAGGAYVPFDPSYPEERLAFMLEDAGVAVLLTQEHLLERLPAERPETLCLDRDQARLNRESASHPHPLTYPENPAYTIYTSGTTGRPKGAMNPHRGIVNRLLWMQETYGLEASDRVLQKTTFSFDVSVWEFFWPLMVGARVVLARPDGHGDPAYLADLIAEQGITTLHFVPSMLQSFLGEPRLMPRCASLRRVIASGEALPWELQERFHRRLPASLHNLYGPTEAAIDVSFQPCVRGDARPVVPIGRPIANLRLHLLGADGEQVPLGAAGELHIGGVGLARGYHHRPALTAEKFVPDPLASTGGWGPGSRLYRTGDLVRHLPTGELIFLGRIDHQVKIRGFRIELGDIEAALLEHPAVHQAVVVVREEAPGPRLVAYLVGEEALPEVGELRRFLLERLPDYMTPASFVALETLPLTLSGKVDRRALPAPEGGRLRPERTYVAPRNGAEEALVHIWQEVLRLERVGIRDNFFELGGDSILSILVVTRARRAGLQLTPRQIFQHQTVAELVTVAVRMEGSGADRAEQGTVIGSIPLSPIQHWFFDQDFVDPHHFNQARLLSLPATVEPERLATAAARLLAHHDALRLRFTYRGGVADGSERAGGAAWEQVSTGLVDRVPFTSADLSALPAASRRSTLQRATAACQTSLDLERGPLLRFLHINLAPREPSRLLIVIHHLVVDGVSWRILLEDLRAFCDVAARDTGQNTGQNTGPQLPPKTTSWKAWNEGLTALARSGELAPDAEAWLSSTTLHSTTLPVDHPQGVPTEASTRTVSGALTADETEALLRDVPQAYQTQLEEVLLTALARTFARWTGSKAVHFDLEGHGREEVVPGADVSRTVGWFTTIYPTVLEVTADGDPGTDLKTLKERIRRIPKRGLSYGLLRYLSADEHLAPALGALPPAEVLFNYLGQQDATRPSEALLAPAEALLAPAEEDAGPTRSPRALRSHLLEILARVAGGRLRLHWRFSAQMHRRGTIEALGADFLRDLRELIAHCTARTETEYTPSDFPDLDLSQDLLDSALAELEID